MGACPSRLFIRSLQAEHSHPVGSSMLGDGGPARQTLIFLNVRFLFCRATPATLTTWPTSTTSSTPWSSTSCCGWWSLWRSPSSSCPTTCGTWTRATTASSTGWPTRRSGRTKSSACPSGSLSWMFVFCVRPRLVGGGDKLWQLDGRKWRNAESPLCLHSWQDYGKNKSTFH